MVAAQSSEQGTEFVGSYLATSDQTFFNAQVVEFTGKNVLARIRNADESSTQQIGFPLVEIFRFGQWPLPSNQRRVSNVYLIDGSRLAGRLVRWNVDGILLDTTYFGQLKIAIPFVAAIAFAQPKTFQRQLYFERRLLNRNKDQDSLYRGFDRPDLGVVRVRSSESDLEPASVQWTSSQDTNPTTQVPLDWNSIAGLSFAASPNGFSETPSRLLVGLDDSSLLSLVDHQIQVGGTHRLEVALPLALPASKIQPENFVYLASQSAAQSLTDQPAAAYRFASPFFKDIPIGNGTDVFGEPVFHESAWIRECVSQHANSTIAYRLPANAVQLSATLAFANSAHKGDQENLRLLRPSATAQVLRVVGGKTELAFTATVPSDSTMLDVQCDLTNCSAVVLMITSTDSNIVGDEAVWVDLRITFSKPVSSLP
jgi:hypothetical protein